MSSTYLNLTRLLPPQIAREHCTNSPRQPAHAYLGQLAHLQFLPKLEITKPRTKPVHTVPPARAPGVSTNYLSGTCAWLQPVFQEPGASRLIAVDSSIRSTTRFEAPSSDCTRSPDEISTIGFSSKSWQETNFRRQRGGGGGGRERGEGRSRERRGRAAML
ncbi:hypothetical protein F511_10814 [Dorcoceras hygrometricum]|uniref:Uncharacterized protein n=1 Tax=Dorcoceras hygrometricum TaxID=472368 RepID=A0A2Z7B9J3_9LAMI|nr:hypothetical protein F511_10814 [Dorcoceras hygrometricum]